MPDLLTEISYEEMQGSPSETLTREGLSAVRTLKVAWGSRAKLRKDLLKTNYPGATRNVVCVSASSVPFPAQNIGADHVSSYAFAIVTLQYEPATPPSATDNTKVITTENIEPMAEFLTTGVNNLRWGSNDGDQVTQEESPGQLLVGFDYVVEREGLQTFPSNLLALIGKVNDIQISPTSTGLDALSFEAETLLYNPPSVTPGFDQDGNRIWDVTYRFTYKPNWDGLVARGWNWFWRPSSEGGGSFDAMYEAGAGGVQYKPYTPGDFTTI